MDHKTIYEGLKIEADNHYNRWSVSGDQADWQSFKEAEYKVSIYAYEHESEIWDDC